eukprot:5409055-Prymnesium_polylepis.1
MKDAIACGQTRRLAPSSVALAASSSSTNTILVPADGRSKIARSLPVGRCGGEETTNLRSVRTPSRCCCNRCSACGVCQVCSQAVSGPHTRATKEF